MSQLFCVLLVIVVLVSVSSSAAALTWTPTVKVSHVGSSSANLVRGYPDYGKESTLLAPVTPTNCGGVGEFVELRVSSCAALPCTIDATTLIELDFKPRATSFDATLRFTVTPMNGSPVSESASIGFIIAGLQNTITLSDFQPVFSGPMTLKLEILSDTNAIEICVSGAFVWQVAPTTTTTTTPRTTTTTLRTTTTTRPTTTTTRPTTTTTRPTTTTTTLRTTTTRRASVQMIG